MALGKEFLGEGHALVPAFGSRELQKLAHGEVPGMCGHEVEKASLVFGVAEAAKVGETEFRKVHRLKMCSIRVHRECAASGRPRHAGRRSGSRRELWPPLRGGASALWRLPRPSCESPCRGRSCIRVACRGSGFPCGRL